MRNDSVGTDTSFYASWMFNDAKYYDTLSDYIKGVNTEWFYGSINYIISRFTDTLQFFLFFVQILTMSLFYRGFVSYSKKGALLWVMVILYMLFFYNQSLNLIRQSIAIAYVFLIYNYILESKYKKYILLSVLSVFIHSSAPIGCIMILLLHWVSGMERGKRIFMVFVGMSFMVGFLVLYSIAMDAITKIPFLSKYSAYANGGVEDRQGVGVTSLLFRFAFVVNAVIAYRLRLLDHRESVFLIIVSLFETIIFTFGIRSVYAFRIGLYLTPLQFYYTAKIVNSPRYTNGTKICMSVFYMFVYLTYFVWLISYRNESATYPYESDILNIN
ncbi:MAG: EpsG family protein [Paludibacteraceae bacterium]|nr:EpsG family protein [Paludibacteraceae bacterium]